MSSGRSLLRTSGKSSPRKEPSRRTSLPANSRASSRKTRAGGPNLSRSAASRWSSEPRSEVSRACPARLLEYLLHVQDEVGAVARLGHARVRHAIGGYGLLRIRDIGVQRLRCPGDAAALERGGITKVVHIARSSAENSVQTRAHPLHSALECVAGVALLEQLLAVLGIALRVREAGRQYEARRRRGGPWARAHADTSGPGFFI